MRTYGALVPPPLAGAALTALCLFGNTVFSQDRTPAIRVERMAIAADIIDREPAGVSNAFPDTVGTLYCFTLVTDFTDTTSVTHLWYHGDKLYAEVTLRVAGPRWRTWSSKKIVPGWTGPWRVVVISAEGLVLKMLRFRIEKFGP